MSAEQCRSSANSTRRIAIDGLRAIAAVEEAVARAIDEPGYYGEVAEILMGSAGDRRLAAQRLEGEAGRPRLRLVRAGRC